jgi:hypothetical protein
MATCPHCHGFLSETHQCTGAKRRRVRRLLSIGATGLGCGLAGIIVTENALWGLSGLVVGTMAAAAVWRE